VGLTHYTRLWNPILEALSLADLTPAQYRLVLGLVRKTYKWGETTARLSYREWSELTGIEYRSVRRPLKQLQEANVIHQVAPPTFNEGAVYRLNKDVRAWTVLSEPLSDEVERVLADECGVRKPADSTQPSVDYAGERMHSTQPSVDPEAYKPEAAWDTETAKEIIKRKVVGSSSFMQPEDEVEQQISRLFTPLLPKHLRKIHEWRKRAPDEVILAALQKGQASFKPSYEGDKIGSLNYFDPIIDRLLATEKVREEVAANADTDTVDWSKFEYRMHEPEL